MNNNRVLQRAPRKALSTTTAAIVALSLTAAADAGAATVSKAFGTISVRGTSKPDSVSVGPIRDHRSPPTRDGWYFFKGASPGHGCVRHHLGAACDPHGASTIRFDGYAGNDRMSANRTGSIAVRMPTTWWAGKGNDVLNAGGGPATLMGGPGDDKLRGGPRNDFISGEGGDDEIGGFAGHDVLTGGFGRDGIAGGAGNDQIVGGGGMIDVMDGGSGEDQLWGQPGNVDTFWTNDGERDTTDCLGGFNSGDHDALDELINC